MDLMTQYLFMDQDQYQLDNRLIYNLLEFYECPIIFY